MAYQGIIFGVLLSVTFCNYCRPVLSAVTENEVLERIAAIEDGQAICSRKNEMLEMKVKMLEKKNNELENRLRTQETVKIGMWSEIKEFVKAKDELMNQTIARLQAVSLPSVDRRQLAAHPTEVAFSTYLDHNVDNLGPDQVIVFNQVHLNIGNGYNVNTGAFTVPTSGVYVFTFFIGERGQNQLFVKLVVNGVAKADAGAETVSSSHDAQGGNVVILNVSKGDSVMIEHNTWGTHIEGYPDIRLSTFSGFLLYAIEGGEVVGK